MQVDFIKLKPLKIQFSSNCYVLLHFQTSNVDPASPGFLVRFGTTGKIFLLKIWHDGQDSFSMIMGWRERFSNYKFGTTGKILLHQIWHDGQDYYRKIGRTGKILWQSIWHHGQDYFAIEDLFCCCIKYVSGSCLNNLQTCLPTNFLIENLSANIFTKTAPKNTFYCISINKFPKNFQKSAKKFCGAFGAAKTPFFPYVSPKPACEI